ncbi:hypothetical protein CEXT_586491 [Caerostris extrusa]|uniref:Uncharacterized protein n=1 Tax=Caerostris extrusa TaxID=172846 RepID=A0AAV4RAL3_CAEEX|nr:hypothetical protein CEXT_586491 [Caerostris extrusa]
MIDGGEERVGISQKKVPIKVLICQLQQPPSMDRLAVLLSVGATVPFLTGERNCVQHLTNQNGGGVKHQTVTDELMAKNGNLFQYYRKREVA